MPQVQPLERWHQACSSALAMADAPNPVTDRRVDHPVRRAVEALFAARSRTSGSTCALRRLDCPFRARCRAEAASLARARAGSRQDFDLLFDRYFSRLYADSSRWTRDRAAAEQIAREALVSVFGENGPKDCISAHLLGWLVVRREAARRAAEMLFR